MVRLTNKTFAGAMARTAATGRVFYFCGPDEAGASAALDRLAAHLGAAERVELAGADLRRDPVRLADEVRSTSLFGDTRQIWVRCQGDEAYDAIANCVADPVPGWPVLILASNATDKSRVAKLLGDRPDAMVAMFQTPDLRSVTDAVRDMAGGVGLRLDAALAERIARGAGLDVRLARSELEKLALYCDASPQAPRNADAAALDAVGATITDDGMAALVDCVLSGDSARLAGELGRAQELGLNPVGLVLALERRAAQLVQLAAALGPRGDPVALIENEVAARRVFFRDKAALSVQLRRWRGRRLERLVQRLVALHARLVSDNRAADLMLAQGLADILRAAAPERAAKATTPIK